VLERYVYPDGADEVAPGRFFDTARDEHCAPAMWSDGQTICTPDAGEVVYTDADCTAMIGRVGEAERPRRYVLRTYTLRDGEHPSKLFDAGDHVTAPAQIWRMSAGSCVGPQPPAVRDRFYAVGAEVARDELVRLRYATSTEPSRLTVVSLVSDDGLHAPSELRDRTLDVPCDLDLTASGGAIACIPHDAREALYYADAACRVAELDIAYDHDGPSVAWTRDAATGCTSYRALGPIATWGPVFRMIAGRCQQVSAPDDAALVRAADPFEPVTLARTREARDDRRLLAIHVADGALDVRDPRLYDTALHTECLRTQLAPSDVRCVPITDTRVAMMYADTACASPVYLALVDTRACAPRAAYARYADSDLTTLHAIGAPHTTPVYMISTGEPCAPYRPLEEQALYDVGPAVAIDQLARATLQADR
jgi:hypothetical protein